MGVRFEEVQARIHVFCKRWPDAEWGPAHIILSDYNLEDYWFDGIRDDLNQQATDESRATLAFLDELQAIPEDDRCPDRGGPVEDASDTSYGLPVFHWSKRGSKIREAVRRFSESEIASLGRTLKYTGSFILPDGYDDSPIDLSGLVERIMNSGMSHDERIAYINRLCASLSTEPQ